MSPGPLKTRAASGLKDFDLLLTEAAQRAPLGEAGRHHGRRLRLRLSGNPYARRISAIPFTWTVASTSWRDDYAGTNQRGTYGYRQELAKSMDVLPRSRSSTGAHAQGGEHYDERVKKVRDDYMQEMATVTSPLDVMRDWSTYAIDSMQRGILFLDAMRQRGNQYLEHTRAGCRRAELRLRDGARRPHAGACRQLRAGEDRAAAGITIDAKRRPYVIIDPRAGHGPGNRWLQGRLAGRRRVAARAIRCTS